MGHSMPILPDQQRFGPTGLENYFIWIREKNKWVLTMGGERVLLYKKKYEGQRCPEFDTVRHTNAQHEDTICYGQGFVGGFFQPIEIVISLLSSGPEQFTKTEFGIQRVYTPHSWSLWEPMLSTGDMVVRRNNQRFLITSVFPRRFKHFVTHIDFDLAEIERGSILYTIPSGL